MTQANGGPVWKKVIAFVLDLSTVWFAAGYSIGMLAGQTTNDGFDLQGGPALLLVVVVFCYFWLGNKYCSGTIWKHVLGTAPLRFS